MIDQAKNNLGTPIKFKFSGIYKKYINGLRKREIERMADIERLESQEEEFKGRPFKSMSQADQIDEVIMKYIFNKPEKKNTFRQFSLIQDVNLEMVLDTIPPIAYDSVESYWKRKYIKENASARNYSAKRTEEIRHETTESAR